MRWTWMRVVLHLAVVAAMSLGTSPDAWAADGANGRNGTAEDPVPTAGEPATDGIGQGGDGGEWVG